jgi:hypothetical protein
MYEEATVAAALLTLCEIYRGLGQGGKALRHPLETLRSRKAACIVSSLQDVVAIAQLRKVDGDTCVQMVLGT